MNRPSYKIISIEDLRSTLQEVFSLFPEIMIAYLYGSYANNNQNEFSDVDVGIVINESERSKTFDILGIGAQIEKKFNYEIELDLRILNDCPPRFLHQVLKNGFLLYNVNNSFKDEFELRVITEYLDIKPILDSFDQRTIVRSLE